MKRTRIALSIAAGVGLLLFAALCWNTVPVAAGPVAQVTLTPRAKLTPTPGGPAPVVVQSEGHPPRLHGAIFDWGKGNMPAGVQVVLRGDGWEIPVETDGAGEYQFKDIGNEVAFLNATVPGDREDLYLLTADLPVLIQVDKELIVNVAFYPKGITPDPLVQIEMTSSAADAAADENVSYTITVINNWEEGINQVIVADYLPEGLTYVTSTASQGDVVWDRGLVWASLGSLGPGASAVVTIVAKVDSDVERGATITNRAAAYYSENVAVQAEASFKVVGQSNGVLPVTGLSSLLPVVGILLIGILFGMRRLRRTAR